MSGSFNVSDDFAAFEAESGHAAAEAAKQERMVMGIPMPIGTVGVCSVADFETGKTKIKEDPHTKQPTGGAPMITVHCIVDTPKEFVGQKVSRVFAFQVTAKSSLQQCWQRFYDALEGMGMPRELRGKPVAEMVKFFQGDTVRKFNYEVARGSDPQYPKNFNILNPVNTSLPDVSDIQGAAGGAATPTFAVGDKVTCLGNPCEVIAVTGPDQYKIKFPNGQEMPAEGHNLTK